MIPEGETIDCRFRGPDCQHGRPTVESEMDPEGAGMREDGTWDGETVVCDPCYVQIGGVSYNPNPGAVGGGAGSPDKPIGERISIEEAVELLAVNDGRVHTARIGSGAFIGADWDLEDACELIGRFHATKLGSPVMGHGLLVIDGAGAIVLETV